MQARAAIYLDANAGAPLCEAARVALISFLCETRAEALGQMPSASARVCFEGTALNPSSQHSQGRRAKGMLREARTQVAASLGKGVRPEDLVFVSSGTEAAQMAVRSVLEPRLLRGEKPHWIFSAGDHEAHRQMKAWLEDRGGRVSVLPLTADGSPALSALPDLLGPETALVSAVWVNNETGVITDVRALSELCRAHAVPLHLDGAQAWGKLALDLSAGLAEFVSFSGHKIGALAGTGVLWRASAAGDRGTGAFAIHAPIFPGKQESGGRGGTENLFGLVSLGAAAHQLDPLRAGARVGELRDRLEQEIVRTIPGARIYGGAAPRVFNTSFLGFSGVEKEGLVAALDLQGYCVSAGSACSSGITEPSPVLLAMGLSPAEARAAVRVSLHAQTSTEDLQGFISALARAVEKSRGLSVPSKVI